MNDCYILLIGKMRFIYYELKYIKKPHVLVLPDMWLFYYKYITKLSNIAKYFNRLGEKSERTIEPYRLVLKNSNWYVQGYCTMREDYRIFEISNMSSLDIKKETFSPRDFDYNSEDIYFRTNREVITLKLLVDETLIDRMIKYCGKDNVIPYSDDKYICYFPFVEDNYFYNMLIQFGDKCECLEPEHIRINLIKKIENILSIYKNIK